MISISQAVFLTLAVARQMPDAEDHEIDSAINFVDNMLDENGEEDAYEHAGILADMVHSVCDAIRVNRDLDRPVVAATYLDLVA